MKKDQIRGVLTDISCEPTNSPDRDLYTLLLNVDDIPQPIYVHTDYALHKLLNIGETYLLTGQFDSLVSKIDTISLVQETLTNIKWHGDN